MGFTQSKDLDCHEERKLKMGFGRNKDLTIKIYNQLRLNTDFLPYNYPKTMEFVVMGIGHKIDGSGWTTSINAIGKPQDDGKPLPPTTKPTQGPLQKPNSTAGFSTFSLIDNNN